MRQIICYLIKISIDPILWIVYDIILEAFSVLVLFTIPMRVYVILIFLCYMASILIPRRFIFLFHLNLIIKQTKQVLILLSWLSQFILKSKANFLSKVIKPMFLHKLVSDRDLFINLQYLTICSSLVSRNLSHFWIF